MSMPPPSYPPPTNTSMSQGIQGNNLWPNSAAPMHQPPMANYSGDRTSVKQVQPMNGNGQYMQMQPMMQPPMQQNYQQYFQSPPVPPQQAMQPMQPNWAQSNQWPIANSSPMGQPDWAPQNLPNLYASSGPVEHFQQQMYQPQPPQQQMYQPQPPQQQMYQPQPRQPTRTSMSRMDHAGQDVVPPPEYPPVHSPTTVYSPTFMAPQVRIPSPSSPSPPRRQTGLGLLLERHNKENGVTRIKEVVRGLGADISRQIFVEDILLEIDGNMIKNMSLDDAKALCRGVEGSIAKVVIDRAGRRFTVNVKRVIPTM